MIQLTKSFVLGALIFLTVLVFWFVLEKENQTAQVIFLDVGQGDSQLIVLPSDIQILIDAGPSADVSAKISNYLPFYDKDIELVILSHPHADHLRGLLSVLKDYNVKNFMFSGANYESKVYADFLNTLKAEGSNVYLAEAGDLISYEKDEVLKILAPFKNTLSKSFKGIHESMVVSELNLGNKKFLLTGDMDEKLEQDLIASYFAKASQDRSNALGDIDVLKVGHHGSKTSTSEALLKIAKPEEAIIQSGRNSYGHPTPLVLDRLNKFGVKIFRNDQLGDVVYK
ncbi:MAG: MBL fold metallo-hydrolase [bacterium]|nr:MBL fold metallo-hydrolase [bacterium]